MASNFDQRAEEAIPAEFRMISGCHDGQTSADVSNVAGTFQLPDPAGRAGGACTASLLQVLYADHGSMSWVDTLRMMRKDLEEKDYSQVPQLSSSRMVDLSDPCYFVKPGSTGVRRAVMIGINYVGQQGELSGCHNDVLNMKQYLQDVEGFEDHNITVLMDDGKNQEPTRANILAAYQGLVSDSRDGDTVFCHYSGHGGFVVDEDGDEDDGYDETLCPVDYEDSGQITDDDLFKLLVHPMATGVTATCLMDCCHSGTVLDLPYRFVADGDNVNMERNEDSDMGGMMDMAGFVFGAIGINTIASAIGSAGNANQSDSDDDDSEEDCCCGLMDILISLFS